MEQVRHGSPLPKAPALIRIGRSFSFASSSLAPTVLLPVHRTV